MRASSQALRSEEHRAGRAAVVGPRSHIWTVQPVPTLGAAVQEIERGRGMGRRGMAVTVSIALAATGATAATAAKRTAGTVRVSISSAGKQGNDISGRFAAPSVARGGIRVAFDSEAKNLVPDDSNGASDVFVRDQKT